MLLLRCCVTRIATVVPLDPPVIRKGGNLDTREVVQAAGAHGLNPYCTRRHTFLLHFGVEIVCEWRQFHHLVTWRCSFYLRRSTITQLSIGECYTDSLSYFDIRTSSTRGFAVQSTSCGYSSYGVHYGKIGGQQGSRTMHSHAVSSYAVHARAQVSWHRSYYRLCLDVRASLNQWAKSCR